MVHGNGQCTCGSGQLHRCWTCWESKWFCTALEVTNGKSNAEQQIIDPKNEPHTLDLWNFTLAVNLTGTFNLTCLMLKHLVTILPEGPDGEQGIIIFVASSAAVSSLHSSSSSSLSLCIIHQPT